MVKAADNNPNVLESIWVDEASVIQSSDASLALFIENLTSE
jgi:hypothetical protein